MPTIGNGYSVGEMDLDRPWGSWEVVAVGNDYCVKRIVVKPGHRLSEQHHDGREEIWTIVEGEGLFTIGEDPTSTNDVQVLPGQTVNIPLGYTHRIKCISEAPLVFIEVQRAVGPRARLDEADIVKTQDDYGRVATQAPNPIIVEAHAEVLDLHRT